MRIEKLEVRGFGRLQQLNLSFSRGFNLVFGGNESGKSTLEWYIRGMLYGLKGGRSTKDGELPPLKRFRPWQTEEYGGRLDYRLDNGRGYRVVRNFLKGTANVYDETFRDITHSFDCGRDKAVRFAERHLGLNEGCFERTVLLHQMASRVQDDPSGELTGRLVNAAHTGLEDISWKNAEKALKEALHQHVGTDRSTRRPLDLVNARLQELKDQIEAVREEERQRQGLETALLEEQEVRARLLAEKTLLDIALQICLLEQEAQNNISLHTRQVKDLEEVKLAEEELQKALTTLNELEARQQLYSRFEGLSLQDAEEAAVRYALLTASEESREDKEKRLRELKREAEEQERRLHGNDTIHFPDEAGIARLIQLDRELARVTARQPEWRPEGVETELEKVKARRRKTGAVLAAGGGAALLALFLWIMGFVSSIPGAALLLAAILTGVSAGFFRYKQSREIERLHRQRVKISQDTDAFRQQVEGLKKLLREAFEPAGVANLEELLKKKAEADNSRRSHISLSHEICSLEQQEKEMAERCMGLRKELSDRLCAVGMIPEQGEKLQEMVAAYRKGIEGCLQLQQEQNTWKARVEAGRDRVAELKGRQQMENEPATMIMPYSPEKLQEQLKMERERFQKLLQGETRGREQLELLLTTPSFRQLQELQPILEGNLQKLAAELEEEALRIRELETRLRGGQELEERLAAAEGEREELQQKKEELEDLGTSLSLALEVLSEAAEDIHRDFAPALTHKMGEAIRRISGGRYSEVRMDDGILLKTTAPENGDVVQVLQLSAGTVDQMYLALRLAMASLLSSTGETLPILLDEAFSQYDELRIREAFQYLYEISREKQILFFTCRSREAELAREVFGEEYNRLELNCCGRSYGEGH